MEFAVRHRLPTIVDGMPGTAPLLSYGATYADLLRSATYYVDKILKGDRPGELPIQQPAKVMLRVNMKMATAIGITIPQRWLRFFEQNFCVVKWSSCRG